MSAVDPSGGAQVAFSQGEVTDAEAVAGAVALAVERFGRLDGAINNAGILGPLGPALDLSVEDFDRVIEVNLVGTFLSMQQELLHFRRARAGVVVNVASVNGLVGAKNAAAYAASKHAVIGLTRSAALDFASLGVRINALCPGPFDTALLATSQQGDFSAARARTPMGRVGHPEELGGAAVFLLSDEASYLTGQTLVVDGGLLA